MSFLSRLPLILTLGLVAALGLGGCASPAPASDPQAAPLQGVGDPDSAHPLRVVSYNIRHGRGMDDVVDLERTADVLRALEPDLVGLQEVDREVERSGQVDQAAELGRLLGMTPIFGAFMDYQGGEYGMGILSALPVARSWSIELPPGNEPRVALAAAVTLPAGDTVVAVNVHFDWVSDDGYRFAQASELAAVLDTLSHPYILLGDVNDQPGSRTVELFRERAVEATKPADDRFTFPSVEPRREIDYVFAAPGHRWDVGEVEVIPETVASDHRPVLALLGFLEVRP